MKLYVPGLDMVIVNAPPMNFIIDATEIASRCDGAVFTVKCYSTSRLEMQEAKLQLERTGFPCRVQWYGRLTTSFMRCYHT